jgi:hypothetical protein
MIVLCETKVKVHIAVSLAFKQRASKLILTMGAYSVWVYPQVGAREVGDENV